MPNCKKRRPYLREITGVYIEQQNIFCMYFLVVVVEYLQILLFFYAKHGLF